MLKTAVNFKNQINDIHRNLDTPSKYLLTKELINEKQTAKSEPFGQWSFKDSILQKQETLKVIRW